AEEVEEQRSPFWGSRLAIPLPGTGLRCYTLSPSVSHQLGIEDTSIPSESVSGAAHFLCPVQHSSMLPRQAFCSPFDSELPVCSFFCRRRRRCQDTVPPVVEVWTGTSFSLSGVVSDFVSVPNLAPVITQCPLVAPGGRMRHPVLPQCSLEILHKLFPVPKVNLPLLHGSSPVWLLLGLLILKPVSRTLQCF
ncbi:hypothetical protein XENOCAPTIV_003646, partial [Xenoophorus captivus]